MTMPTDTMYGATPAAAGSAGPQVVPEDPSMLEVWAAGGLKGWQQRQLEQNQRQVALMAGLEQLVAHLGGILSAGQQAPVSDVMYQGTLLIPSNGYLSRSFKQPYASLAIANVGGATLTVQNGAIQGSGAAPAQGSGLATVPAGIFRCFNLRGTVLTVYGTPGAAVDLCVYARPRPPAAGICGAGTEEAPQELLVANPAAGVQPSGISPSPNAPFQLQSFWFLLNTDATVANRDISLEAFDAAGNFLFRSVAGGTQVASTTQRYSGAIGFVTAASLNGVFQMALPNIWLPAGATFTIQCSAIDAGDTITGIVFTYRTAQ